MVDETENQLNADAGSDNVVSLRDGGAQTMDSMLDVIADERRRQLLQHIQDADGIITYDELIDRLVAVEEVDEADTVRQQLNATLYHIHIPKLADYGVIECNNDEIRFTGSDEILDLVNRVA